MNAYRKKPEIGKTNSLPSYPKSDDDSRACVWIPLIIVISYFVLSAIIRVTSNSGSKLDQIVCYGTLICLVIIMLLGARDLYRDSQVAAAERQQWKNACISAELTITNRHEGGSFWYDYGNRYLRAPYQLELELNSNQRTVSPGQTIVSVEVSADIYKRLEECKTVRIYYMPESPMTFLLEDEL